MNIIAIDDERLALIDLKRAILNSVGAENITCFRKSEEALKYVNENKVNVAFLDIEMGDVNGIEFAKMLKEVDKNINIIFTTAHSQYAINAFNIYASGYLLKPISGNDIKTAIKNLRTPVMIDDRGLFIKTFGSFEVFFDKTPVKFKYNKTKELFAFLVDKCGSSATYSEIRAALWEDKPDTESLKSQLRNSISDLQKTLKSLGVDNVILKKGHTLAVIKEKIRCDYYEWLNGDMQAVNEYKGKYMEEYSWAECTLGYIERNQRKD